MDKKKVGTAAFLIGLILILFFWNRHASARKPILPSPETGPLKAAATASVEDKQTVPLAEKQQQYLDRAKAEGKSMNRPMDFFGQIVDQNNKPVVGGIIKIGLSRFSDVVLPDLTPNYIRAQRITDNLGKFSVESESGVSLDVEILPITECDVKPKNLQVSFRDVDLGKSAPVVSTRERPYIFHAFRKDRNFGGILKGEITAYNFEPDGRWYTVRLKENQMLDGATSGDFRVSLIRPAGWSGQLDYDWTLNIEGIDVQLLENRDEFNYVASLSGYVGSWSISKKAGSAGYSREAAPIFFFKDKVKNLFGQMQFDVKSDSREKSAVLLQYWIDPTGGRVLR